MVWETGREREKESRGVEKKKKKKDTYGQQLRRGRQQLLSWGGQRRE